MTSPDRISPSAKRRAEFLAPFGLTNKTGLEIGPLDRPVFDRSAFPNILYADVRDTEELRVIAQSSPLRNAEDVVPVDYVLLDKRLDEVVPHGSLDFVFGAHVLEHIPDMIGMLHSVDAILKPGGLFLVVYPDRRYTYDIDRPATTLEQLKDRHARRITRPDPETVHEHFSCNRKVYVGRLWKGLDDAVEARRFTPAQVNARTKSSADKYIDCHCNVLSSAEFAPMVEKLREEGLTTLEVVTVEQTRAPLDEFYIALRKPGTSADGLGQRIARALGLGKR